MRWYRSARNVPARDGRFEVLVGRGHETDVDGNLAVTADGTDTPLLQGAQQLYLRFVTQVPYFVEKQRASVGRLESARLVGQSPREGPLDMTEKLRSRQIAGNGPAVDRHEGLSGPLAFPVDQLRHMGSLPVPLAPLTSTDILVGATSRMCSYNCRAASLRPSM